MKNENAKAREKKNEEGGTVGDKGRVKNGRRARGGGGAVGGWRGGEPLYIWICSYTLIVLLKADFIYYWSSLGPFYMTLQQRDPSVRSEQKHPTCCLFTGRLVFRQYSKSVNLIWDLLTKLPEVSVSTFTAVVGCLTRSTGVRRRKTGIIYVSWEESGKLIQWQIAAWSMNYMSPHVTKLLTGSRCAKAHTKSTPGEVVSTVSAIFTQNVHCIMVLPTPISGGSIQSERDTHRGATSSLV